MRISSLTMKNNYVNTLNKNQKRLYDANMKVATGRRFKTVSEDVALAMRSMKVRRDLSKVTSYRDNVKETQSIMKAAEDTIRQGMIPQGQVIQEKYIMALNGTSGPDEYEAINAEITRIQDDMLTNLNSQFAGRYLYGGSQVDGDPPFSVFKNDPGAANYDPADDQYNGLLMYKGMLVEAIGDPSHPKYDATVEQQLLDDPVYIDIGLGMKLDGNGDPIPGTVFNRSFIGLDITGIGKGNLYDVITRIRSALTSGILEPELLSALEKANNNLTLTVSKMGADSSFLDFNLDRLVLENDNLIERQQGLEYVEEEEAILEFSMQEFTYNACLQMGSKLLQPSLFSYLG